LRKFFHHQGLQAIDTGLFQVYVIKPIQQSE
jgi:hypothetical protein